jgi:hypothetical protein
MAEKAKKVQHLNHEPVDHGEWRPGTFYNVGDHVQWQDVELVCCRIHFAGDGANHPWDDPGSGWSVYTACTLWAPLGEDEFRKLALAIRPFQDQRLLDIVTEYF